jgi:hypothetical protein
MKKQEIIEAVERDGYIYPKGNIMEGIGIGRNRIIRDGKVVRIDLKPFRYSNKWMFKVTEYTR